MRDFIQALICIAYHRQAPQLWLSECKAYRRHELTGRRSFRQLLSTANTTGSAVLESFEQLLCLCESQLAKPMPISNFNDPWRRLKCSSQEDVRKTSKNKSLSKIKHQKQMKIFFSQRLAKRNLSTETMLTSGSPLQFRNNNVVDKSTIEAQSNFLRSTNSIFPHVASLPYLDLNPGSRDPRGDKNESVNKLQVQRTDESYRVMINDLTVEERND